MSSLQEENLDCSSSSFDEWQTATTNLQERLEIMHKRQPFADVRFRVEVRRPDGITVDVQYFKAHRLVLSVTSPVFAQQFYGETKFQSDGYADYKVTDIEHKAFENMLTYMYEGSVTFKTSVEALQTFKAAKKYKIEHLENLCSEHIRNSLLSPNEVIPIMEDPLHLEISGLRQQCIDVAEDKPLDVLRLAAEKAKPKTIETFLEMERLAISSELFLLRALVEGATARCHRVTEKTIDKNMLENFIRQFLKHIRFLTMTPQEFALATELCGSAITNEEGYAILLALSHPGSKTFRLPTWCNQITRIRLSQARNVLEICLLPQNPIFGDYTIGEQTRSLISSLEITVHAGRFVFTGVVLLARRVLEETADIGEEPKVPSARCTLNIRNNAAGIAFEQVKNMTFDTNNVVLPFPIPLPVSQGQEAKVSVTLDEPVGLDFGRFLTRLCYVGEEQKRFRVALNNYRLQDDSFAIAKLYYMN